MNTRWQTLHVERQQTAVVITMSRPDEGNTLTQAMIREMHAVLDACKTDPDVRIIALTGRNGVFCDGMDFQEASDTHLATDAAVADSIAPFFDLMQRFTRVPQWLVAMVDGRVNAGGMGLVAAADFVLATPRSTFGLSEVMFGLIPATVAPFLIRRCGFQATYRLSLLAQRIDAAQARDIHLVDDVVSNLEDGLRLLRTRIDRMRPEVVVEAKSYFADLWPITDETRCRAIGQIARMIANPTTLSGIRNFIEGRALPWQKPSG